MNVSMKKVLSYFVLLFVSVNVSAGDLSDENTQKDSWVYSLKEKAEKKLLDSIEDAVNDYFEGDVWSVIGEKIGEELGNKFFENLSGFVSVGPFLSMDSFIGGSSESEVMTKVLLNAIEQSKDEIINAVEKSYQNETEANLDALILDYAIFSSRSEEFQQNDFRALKDFSQAASNVKKRLQQTGNKLFDNLHLYMTVAGLHIEIQKQYSRRMAIDLYGNPSPSIVETDYKNVLKTLLQDSMGVVVDSEIGSYDRWEKSFYSSFGESAVYAGSLKSTDSVPSGYHRSLSGRFYYLMNGHRVYFKVLSYGECDVFRMGTGGSARNLYAGSYAVFDASGKFIKKYWISSLSIDVCNGVQKNLVRSSLSTKTNGFAPVIQAHKDSKDAFLKYLKEGYLPVKRMFDAWWDRSGMPARRYSEVDVFVENNF